ncbi:hybrid sensor histidine kinase/response regulator transcription factor [Desertivirga arenae]|uniref:hybrid sensor histidine kinase/response regulator transcription factor n=1 Tax=Desertivirga arenae TaxID=2810309 RepID=UPI001A96D553|nr:two-component regulator propeller domain-containing protein [Pedobacter sp. SYSU D00823]
MSIFRIALLLSLSLAIVQFPLQAQESTYTFSHLNNSQGLSHNQVNTIYKDKQGFLWIGTLAGLNRYDGYRFKIFRHDENNKVSLSDEYVTAIYDAPKGKMLIETGSGFNIYDPDTESFDREAVDYFKKLQLPVTVTYVHKDTKQVFWFIAGDELYRLLPGDDIVAKIPGTKNISFINNDAIGNLWLSYTNGSIEKRDHLCRRILERTKTEAHGRNKFFIDQQNGIWLYVSDNPQGVFYRDPGAKSISHFNKGSSRCPLSSNLINGVVQDGRGNIWLGTDHGGINIINKNDFTVRYLQNREGDGRSIAQNSLVTIYRDEAGFIWAGTYKRGISYYNENAFRFPIYQHQPYNNSNLPYDDVNRFAEDRKGNLWIGTNGGGLIYFDRSKNSFRQYKHQSGNTNSLSNDVIVSLWIDRSDKLWIGTFFGGLDCFDGKTFKHYKHNSKDPQSLSDDKVWEILEDRKGNLWVGTLSSGLDLLDRESGKFRHFIPGRANSVNSTYISAFAEDKAGNLWVGTANGLSVRNSKTGRFTNFVRLESNPHSLSNNFVYSLLCDSRGLIWVGTRSGLNYYDPALGYFKSLSSADGLPDNTILNILEDAHSNLWISTPNGLSKITIRDGREGHFSFKNYDEADGLQGRSFNENAALRTSTDELIFGGPNGFNIFLPARLHSTRKPHKLAFTDFSLFNKSVGINEKVDNDVILPESLNSLQEVVLNHDQNVFAIEFAALGAGNPEKVNYAYMLEGFDKRWFNTDGKLRKATYTNLDPGHYTFKVKASNDDGSWNEEVLSLNMVINPPFWKTPVAYFLYFLAAVGALLFIRRRGIEKLKRQFALEHERQEARRMHELDMLKIKFFTNVSHEFRTPLSLILAPVERILTEVHEPERKHQLQMIHRNGRRLLNLVNQLLDFRKMEVRELRLHTRKGDLIDFMRDTFFSFTDIADKKHICFSFKSDIDSLNTEFDSDKIERILFNLLSNAFKFTPNNGQISLEILSRQETEQVSLEIRVKDTGIGIPAEKRDKVFERFFQNEMPGSIVNQGSGIGLAITREFVVLHGGTIRVESEENLGSCFILNFTFKITDAMQAKKVEIEEIAENKPSPAQQQELNHKKKTVLLVEDNDDFRFYLKDNLRQFFNILEAGDGKEGWQKSLATHPDLIVSDISMPQMNGIDLCMKLKADKRTTHIPVILLTALAGEEQQLKGLETGATDYMTKPFNFEILLSKIRNLIQQQDTLKRTYVKQVDASPVKVEIESSDERFISRALAELEKNIANADYSVEELSSSLNLSRVALYKKMLALTGKAPAEFIRSFRLKRAAQLLLESQLTVAEVAFRTGFNNPKYFAKYFKAEFGTVPSAYAEGKIKEVKPF